MRVDPIVRGVLLVWFLKFISGFVVSVAAGIDLQLNAQGVELVLAASDIYLAQLVSLLPVAYHRLVASGISESGFGFGGLLLSHLMLPPFRRGLLM